MRTVSFSDKRVADRVNAQFVAAWINRGPGFRNNEYWTETGIVQNHYEAYPTKNICTFFLNPEGKVFFYVAGSYSPELFLEILDTVWTLRKALFDDRMAPRTAGLVEAARIHGERADAFQDSKDRAERAIKEPDGWRTLLATQRSRNYRGLKHVHSPTCASSLREGYDYLALLHQDWANRTNLPPLGDVQYKYFYGNEFTEETADSHHISRPEPSPPANPNPAAIKPQRCETQRVGDLFGIGLFGRTPGEH